MKPSSKSLWRMLTGAAVVELERILEELPRELSQQAGRIPVTLEDVPGPELVEDGVEADTLGLFVGPAHTDGDTAGAELPSQIILYLGNLWDFSGRRPRTYREEVRRTLLHELGHYLGLDEAGLALRDLD